MKKVSRIFIILLATLVLGWFLPWLYSLLLPTAQKEPFCAFSPVSSDWVITTDGPKGDKIFVDSQGGQYTKQQRDSLLPQMFYRDLMANEKLPDSINGHELSVPNFKHNEMVFTSYPRDLNKKQPSVYLMMESMPERVDLDDPNEVFSIDGGKMQFTSLKADRDLTTRSNRFTTTLAQRGFQYPMADCNANVTAKKQYDEGYLMIDNSGTIFHVKQQAGRPYVAKVNMPDSVKARKVFILENMDKSRLGLVFDTENNTYFLMKEGYRLVKLPVGKINPFAERITIMGNLFNIVFRITGDDGLRYVAIDNDDFHLLGEQFFPNEENATKQVSKYLFPFRVRFTSTADSYARLRFVDLSFYAIALNILLSIALMVIMRKRKPTERVCAGVITVVCGIFSFVPFAILKN